MMTFCELKQRSETFFEWNYENQKDYVTLTSAILFAQHIAELAVTAEREKLEAGRIKAADVLMRNGYLFHRFTPEIQKLPDGNYTLYADKPSGE